MTFATPEEWAAFKPALESSKIIVFAGVAFSLFIVFRYGYGLGLLGWSINLGVTISKKSKIFGLC